MNSPIVSEALTRIAIAQREQRTRSVAVSPTVQRILRRWMVGNEEETLDMLCRVADECLVHPNRVRREFQNHGGRES